MKEVFKNIKGYEELYQISNIGRVKIKNPRFKSKKYLKSSPDGWGYLKVSLYKNKTKKTFKIHRLVALHFLKKESENLIVNHKNGIKTDNEVKNLEWCTYSENNKHAISIKLAKSDVEHPNSKLNKSQIKYIVENFDYNNENFNTKAMAEKFGVSKNIIRKLLNNKTYRISNTKKISLKRVLSEEEKKEISRRYIPNHKKNSCFALAKEFDVCMPTIKKIVINNKIRITEEDANWIKKNYKARDEKHGTKAMAKKFGVSNRTIWKITNNKIQYCK